jgi:hypothetical protein
MFLSVDSVTWIVPALVCKSGRSMKGWSTFKSWIADPDLTNVTRLIGLDEVKETLKLFSQTSVSGAT